MGNATVDFRSGIKLVEACTPSNLRSFLHSVTPTLEAYTVAKCVVFVALERRRPSRGPSVAATIRVVVVATAAPHPRHRHRSPHPPPNRRRPSPHPPRHRWHCHGRRPSPLRCRPSPLPPRRRRHCHGRRTSAPTLNRLRSSPPPPRHRRHCHDRRPSPGGYSGRVPDLGRCFYLVDLWNHFYPLSAYGVGTPVRLPSGQEIEQYFVPYLSAIQLYTISDFTSCKTPTGPGDSEIIVDNNNLFDGNNYGWCSVADNWNDQYATTSLARYDSPRSMSTGGPCFQYFECDSPYERMPLADKVYELCYNFPPLSYLNSIELSSSSWMSVFWYPIGHVPAMNKDLTTCFLTYHSLSTLEDRTPFDSKDPLTLPPIGLATHKTDGDVWTSTDSSDQELTTSLVGAADSWLKKLDVQHHDFSYFINSNRNQIHYRSLTEASTTAV